MSRSLSRHAEIHIFHILKVPRDARVCEENMMTVDSERPALLETGKIRVLCLSSDTGGGHRASAQALDDCLGYIYGAPHEVFVNRVLK